MIYIISIYNNIYNIYIYYIYVLYNILYNDIIMVTTNYTFTLSKIFWLQSPPDASIIISQIYYIYIYNIYIYPYIL